MKSGFWKTDWLFGAVAVVLASLPGLLPFCNHPSFDGRERTSGEICEQVSSRIAHDRVPGIAMDGIPIRFAGRAATTDPGGRSRRGETFATALHASYVRSVGKAAVSGGGVDISL